MIISFAWTTDALLAGRKTVTRRTWVHRYFQQWVKAWREGRHIHQAWDKNPRAHGNHVGDIRLTHEPYRELVREMPETDLEAEGGYWGSIEEFAATFPDGLDELVAVIRFELVRKGVADGNSE